MASKNKLDTDDTDSRGFEFKDKENHHQYGFAFKQRKSWNRE